jgi:hypothetical protein
MANETAKAQRENLPWRIVVYRSTLCSVRSPSPLERGVREGENPVGSCIAASRGAFAESGCLGMQP